MSAMAFSLSVDDGHPLDLKLADLLERHGLRASFYVPGSNSEGPPVMRASQLRTLDGRFEIGSHTAGHRFLARLENAAAWREISDGKAALEDVLGHAVQGFCYPGGRYRREQVALVQAAGFRHARTTQNLRIDTVGQLLEMPTTLQFYPHPRSVLLRNFISQGAWPERQAALRAALAESDWRTRLYALFNHACARGAVFHLWLHSTDIEQLQLWQELDAFLACVARRVPPARRLTNGELAGGAGLIPAADARPPVAVPPAGAPIHPGGPQDAGRPPAARPSTP